MSWSRDRKVPQEGRELSARQGSASLQETAVEGGQDTPKGLLQGWGWDSFFCLLLSQSICRNSYYIHGFTLELKKPFIFMLWVWMFGPHAHLCTMCAVPLEARKGHSVPWNGSDRCLWPAMLVLGIEPGYSARATSDLNYWAISLVLVSFSFWIR